ncbi:MAG: LysE family transporter [Pseudomonadota bacterium]
MATLLIGLATFAIVCASPGPAVVAVVSTAMARGFRAALTLTAGLSLALGLWGVLAAAGFGAVLAAAPSALLAFKVLGGAYLLWLAWGAGRSALTPADAPRAVASGFRAGLLLNLSNPKAVFAWTATIAVGTPADMPGLAWVLVPAAMVVTILIYALYAAAFSRPPMRRAYDRARRWIEGAASALFALAGLALLRDAALSLARRA